MNRAVKVLYQLHTKDRLPSTISGGMVWIGLGAWFMQFNVSKGHLRYIDLYDDDYEI